MRLLNRFAKALVRMGIRRGDRVFVFLPRVPETYIGILGILKVGAIPSPLFEAFMTDAVRDRMQDAAAVALLTPRPLLERVPEGDLPSLKHVILVGGRGDSSGRHRAWDEEMEKSSERFDVVWLGREDPLILHYTSGSTGKPKGALHVQNAMVGHYQTGRWVLDLKPTDTYWCTADPGWVTHNWWMTETGHQLISNYPSMDIRPGSMGKPIPGVEAAILDEKGNRLPPNTLGLLCIKAGWPGMMRQIWNNPARYQEYFRFPGYYFTGDTAHVDEDGYFWFQGRADDVINTAGERVGPFVVESALVSHP